MQVQIAILIIQSHDYASSLQVPPPAELAGVRVMLKYKLFTCSTGPRLALTAACCVVPRGVKPAKEGPRNACLRSAHKYDVHSRRKRRLRWRDG